MGSFVLYARLFCIWSSHRGTVDSLSQLAIRRNRRVAADRVADIFYLMTFSIRRRPLSLSDFNNAKLRRTDSIKLAISEIGLIELRQTSKTSSLIQLGNYQSIRVPIIIALDRTSAI